MSYTLATYLSQDCSTLANFKAWGSTASASLTNSGWTQTSDTGQVNWTTIASLPTLGTTVYEIWQPVSDPLQTGSTKYFLRVDYGRAAAGSPEWYPTVGFATNGAGSFVGATAGGFGWGNFGNISAIYPSFFCGDVNRFAGLCWLNGNYPEFWGVERTKATNGTDSSDGVVVVQGPGNMNVLLFASTSASTNYGGIAFNPSGNPGSIPFLNNIPLYPVVPIYLGQLANPILNYVMVGENSIGSGGLFTTTLYGSKQTYIKFVNSGSYGWSNQIMCMRFD